MTSPVESPIASERKGVDINPHWGLSICAAGLFFPAGLLAVLFSWLCSEAVAKGNELEAKRYSMYAKNSAIGLLILAVIGVLLFGLLTGTLWHAMDVASKITVSTN
jgi:hypothetical protein